MLTQFYQGDRPIPDTILIPLALEDAESRAEYLSEKRGRQVEILVPQRADVAALLIRVARVLPRHLDQPQLRAGRTGDRRAELLIGGHALRRAGLRLEGWTCRST